MSGDRRRGKRFARDVWGACHFVRNTRARRGAEHGTGLLLWTRRLVRVQNAEAGKWEWGRGKALLGTRKNGVVSKGAQRRTDTSKHWFWPHAPAENEESAALSGCFPAVSSGNVLCLCFPHRSFVILIFLRLLSRNRRLNVSSFVLNTTQDPTHRTIETSPKPCQIVCCFLSQMRMTAPFLFCCGDVHGETPCALHCFPVPSPFEHPLNFHLRTECGGGGALALLPSLA